MTRTGSLPVTLKPSRQAALQAIISVEDARRAGRSLPAMPFLRAFLRLLTGCGRLNTDTALRIPGLSWNVRHPVGTLKQVGEALEQLLASGGEMCPLPLPGDVQAELFPDVMHTRRERRLQREKLAFDRRERQEEKKREQVWLRRQSLLNRALTELTFQTPRTVNIWYSRWSEEFEGRELEAGFWRWQQRFASLRSLSWLQYTRAPLWEVLLEVRFSVSETAEQILRADCWLVPDKIGCVNLRQGLERA